MKLHSAEFLRCALRLYALTILAASATGISGQTHKPDSSPATTKAVTSGKQSPEQRTAAGMEVAKENPLQLRAFLRKMPKGADLHNHLSGAVYAESFIRAAGEDGLCVDPTTLAFTKPEKPGSCDSKGSIPAADVPKKQALYDSLVDSFSMRGYVPSPGITGHDHFFSTFAKFDGTDGKHKGEWLDEVATRAASQNEQYLELMETPDFSHTAKLAAELGWNDNFDQMREALLSHGLRDDIQVAKDGFDRAEASRRDRGHCGRSQETPACKVQIRFLYQILRGFPRQQVFAQALLGFETASADPRIVGINLVMPEDGYTSMADYALQMKFVGYLHEKYPNVHISLHAGEITPGLVPYEGLRDHIALAVRVAHAERIGHGVDIMYEDNPHELLHEMARNHVMVEISLTSNDVILGVSGQDHPFTIYRMFQVPIALATDDEGVSRINLTNEYFRATQTYSLKYANLKQMVRTSMEYNFLPGTSLWHDHDVFRHPAPECAKDTIGAETPSSPCSTFLASSEKARQQWELERRFNAFEAEN
jgi:adenosine deaminase